MTLSLELELRGRHARLRIGPWRRPWVACCAGMVLFDLGFVSGSICSRRQRWTQ